MIANAARNIFSEAGTREPNRERTRNANAISVAVGIAHPCKASRLFLFRISRRQCSSINAVRPLKLAHIGHDRSDVGPRQTRLRRHVSEFPVMRAHAVGDGHFKGVVSVVRRFVYPMDERRAGIGSGRVLAVARCTDGVESSFSHLCGVGQLRRHDNRQCRPLARYSSSGFVFRSGSIPKRKARNRCRGDEQSEDVSLVHL